MPVPQHLEFFIDPSRCIGCQSCVQACSECDTHRGESMIHLEYVDRARSVQTVPVVCMHCEQPTCAEVCPADAIKRTGDGVVQSARKPRCIACGNCVLACPFGVPELNVEKQLMMKCDMCYDRTSVGKKPMCATVCPSQALFFGTREQILALRPQSMPHNRFRFGDQTITTRVNTMVPRAAVAPTWVDVTAAMSEQPSGRAVRLRVAGREGGSAEAGGGLDPFSEVEVLAMVDDPQRRFEQDLALDPRVDSPGREGLTGTAPASVYAPTREPDEITIAPDFRPRDEQPAWRRDFPIDWPEDQYVARRDFTKFLVLTSGALVAGQAWIAAHRLVRGRRPAPARARIAALSELPVGAARMFNYPGEHDPCVLVRTSEKTIVAYSQKCTHLSCAVVPRVAEGVLHCPCHEGYFDLHTGKNIAGPPPRPLPAIDLEIVGDEVFAVGVKERTV